MIDKILLEALEGYTGSSITKPVYHSTVINEAEDNAGVYKQLLPWIAPLDTENNFFSKEGLMYVPVYEQFEIALAYLTVRTSLDDNIDELASIHLRSVTLSDPEGELDCLTIYIHKASKGVHLVECLFFSTDSSTYTTVCNELGSGLQKVIFSAH